MAAGTVHEIWVRIGATFAGLRAGVSGAKAQIRGLAMDMSRNAEGAKNFGIAATAVGAGVMAMGKQVVDTYKDFNGAVRNAFSVLGSTQDDFKKLEERAKQIGVTGVASAKDAGDAMYYLASAGYNAEEILSSLGGVMNLAAATQYDLAETTRIQVGALKAFGAASSESERYANVFAAGIAATQLNMEKLGDSMKYAAPQAAQLGISVETTTAALGVMMNAGLAASQAGTAFRTGLSRLQNPSKAAQGAIKSLGLSLDDINPQTHTFSEIIHNFEKAGGGAKTSGDEIAEIFGERAAGAFQILIRNGGDALDQLTTKITGTNKAASMIDIQMGGIGGTMKRMKGAIEEVAIQFGEALAPAVSWVAMAIKTLADIVASIPKGFKTFLAVVIGLVGALASIAGPMALFIGFLPRIIAGFKAMQLAMAGTIGPIAGVAIAVAAVTAAVIYFASAEERAKKAQEESIKSMKENIDQQIAHKQGVSDAANEYIKLANTQNRSADQTNKMSSIYKQLNREYPGLVGGASDFATQLRQVQAAAGAAKEELKRMMQQKIAVQRLEITNKILEARTNLRKLQEDMSDRTKWEQGKDAVTNMFSGWGVSAEDAKNNRALMEDLGQLSGTVVAAQERALTGVRLTASAIADQIKKGVAIQRTDESRQEYLMRAQLTSQKLVQRGTDIEMRMAQMKQDAAKQGGATDQKYFDERMRQLQDELSQVNEINQGIMEGTKVGTERQSLQVTINDLEQASAQLTEEQAKAAGVVEDETGNTAGNIGKATDKAKQLRDLLYDLKIGALQEQIDQLGDLPEKQSEAALKAADLQNQIRQLENEKWYKDTLETAKELGVAKSQVDALYASKEKTRAIQNQQDLKKISDTFLEKDIAREMVRMEREGKINQETLNNFKEMLKQKQTGVAQYGEDWNKYQQQIDQIDDAVTKRMLNRANYLMENAKSQKDLDEAFAVYEAYLNEKLAAETEFTDKYIQLVQERKDLEAKKRAPKENKLEFDVQVGQKFSELSGDDTFYKTALEKQIAYQRQRLAATSEFDANYLSMKQQLMDNEIALWKLNHDTQIQLATGTANAIAAGFDVLWNQMGEKYAINAIKIKDIFEGIKRAFYQMIGDMIKKLIISGILKLLGNLIGGSVGGFIAGLAGGGTKASAVGGETTSAGIHNVHAGEELVNAGVVRKNKAEYEKAIGAFGKFRESMKNIFNRKGTAKVQRSGTVLTPEGTMIIPANVARANQKPQQDSFLGSALSSAMGMMNPANLAQVMSAVPSAAYGAMIKRSGLLNVHANEMMAMPASIVRKQSGEYADAAGGGAPRQTVENNTISVVLNNPVVNDKKYWDTAMEKHITPAIKRINRKTGKRR